MNYSLRKKNLTSQIDRAIILWLSIFTVACGGGSSDSDIIEFVPGMFAAASSFEQRCENPRPNSGDLFGSTLEENFWIRSWVNDTYLWFDEVEDQDPALFSSTEEYFQVNRTFATTPSGADRDQFHFTIPTDEWLQLSQSGVVAGYGFDFEIISTNPNEVVITLVEPGSPAANAGIERGDRILAIDGVEIAFPQTQVDLDTINAGLRPESTGEEHQFLIVPVSDSNNNLSNDPINGQQSRSVNLVTTSVVKTPVPISTVIPTDTGDVGYILFNDHVATSERQLIDAFADLAQQGVDDLILDLRYNGGGFLAIASQTAYMIAGPTATNGRTFELSRFNEKHPIFNPVTGEAITPTEFIGTSVGFSVAQGADLPSLDLPRVFVLSTLGTASASEAIINGLRGIGVEVLLFGDRTSGKPFGFFPTDNCGTTYFSIQFQAQNDMGFGDYADGFAPANLSSFGSVPLPGCVVADDYDSALGDPSEDMLAMALAFRDTGDCLNSSSQIAELMPSQQSSPSGSNATSMNLVKRSNPWLENMDMTRPDE